MGPDIVFSISMNNESITIRIPDISKLIPAWEVPYVMPVCVYLQSSDKVHLDVLGIGNLVVPT